MALGPAEHAIDFHLDSNPSRILPGRAVAALEGLDGDSHAIWLPVDSRRAFHAQPAGPVYLADRGPLYPIDVPDLLGALRADDPHQPELVVVGEGDGDDMRRSVGTQGRQGAEMSLGEEGSFGLGEIGKCSGHELGRYRGWGPSG